VGAEASKQYELQPQEDMALQALAVVWRKQESVHFEHVWGFIMFEPAEQAVPEQVVDVVAHVVGVALESRRQ